MCKMYECVECHEQISDEDRLVCEGTDCTASLCMDCAISEPVFGPPVPGADAEIVDIHIFCSACATNEESDLVVDTALASC